MRTILLWLVLTGWLSAGEVSILDYGAVPDDGQDDTAAIQAAMQEGDVVRVPAGVYQLAVSGTTAVTCRRSVKIIGEGRSRSILRTEAELTAGGTAFTFAAGTQATIEGVAIEGPEKPGKLWCVLLVHYGGPGGLLRIDQSRLSGGTIGAKMEELGGAQQQPRMTVLDSLIQSPTGLLHLNSGYLDVVRTEFSKYGVEGSNQAHGVYCYRPVSLLVDRCVFHGGKGNAFDIQFYSLAVSGKGALTARDSEFRGSAPGQGILTHPDSLTLIRGCRLGATAVWVRTPGTVIAETTLKSRAQVKPWPYGPGQATFRDCKFGD